MPACGFSLFLSLYISNVVFHSPVKWSICFSYTLFSTFVVSYEIDHIFTVTIRGVAVVTEVVVVTKIVVMTLTMAINDDIVIVIIIIIK